AEIATSWSPASRAAVASNLSRLGVDDPERVARQLDAYASAWADVHRRTCLANQRNELTPALYQDRLRCLARARSQLATIGEVLAGVKLDGVTDALRAARELPDVAACADDRGIEPPPLAVRDNVDAADREIDRALVLALAHRPESLELAN